MMIPVAEAQTRLAQLIHELPPGEEIILTEDEQPIARVIPQRTKARRPRRAGSARGKMLILREDDEHLEDFAEYMD